MSDDIQKQSTAGEDAAKAQPSPSTRPAETAPQTPAKPPVPEAPPTTTPRRDAIVRATYKLAASATTGAPWLLQQFFNDQVDLSTELASRFPSIPVMSVIRFRNLTSKTPRGVATISTADGTASTTIDVDAASGTTHLSFTYGSMVSLRFRLDDLSSMDRARWMELMRREGGGVAFLWGQARWEKDYVICVTRRRFASLYAFSHNGFEAAVKLTPDVIRKLLDWLDGLWKPETPGSEPPQLLTW